MKQLVKSAIKKSFGAAGFELRRKAPPINNFELEEGSLLVPRIWNSALFRDLIAARLNNSRLPLVILGSNDQIEYFSAGLSKRQIASHGVEWDWQPDVDLTRLPSESPMSARNSMAFLYLCCRISNHEISPTPSPAAARSAALEGRRSLKSS